jgi:hypothetical protein
MQPGWKKNGILLRGGAYVNARWMDAAVRKGFDGASWFVGNARDLFRAGARVTLFGVFQVDRLHPVACTQPKLRDHVWPALVPLLELLFDFRNPCLIFLRNCWCWCFQFLGKAWHLFRAGARVTFFGAKKVTKENTQFQF